MEQYTVRSGQNIYDVALTIYGSVEGLFDLLLSNSWLTVDTPLSSGMQISYHKDFIINQDIADNLASSGIRIKNGDHTYRTPDPERAIKNHISQFHPEIMDSLEALSDDERNSYWETACHPFMVASQYGNLSSIAIRLRRNSHILIDWGDYSGMEIIGLGDKEEIEHEYKGSQRHIITMYGNPEFKIFDIRGIGGIYYALDAIHTENFRTSQDSTNLNKLITVI